MKKNLAMLTLASVLFTSISPLACANTFEQDMEPTHAAQMKAADQRDAVMLTSAGAGYLSALAVAPISWTAFGVAAAGGVVVVPALLAAAAYYELLSVPALPASLLDGSAFAAENLWDHKGEAALVYFTTFGVTTFGTTALKLAAAGVSYVMGAAPAANPAVANNANAAPQAQVVPLANPALGQPAVVHALQPAINLLQNVAAAQQGVNPLQQAVNTLMAQGNGQVVLPPPAQAAAPVSNVLGNILALDQNAVNDGVDAWQATLQANIAVAKLTAIKNNFLAVLQYFADNNP